MRPFIYESVNDARAAILAADARGDAADGDGAQFLAGGTTLLDLMKLDVMRPARVIDINGLQDPQLGAIETEGGLRLGALVRMADAAANPAVQRDYPVIAQSLTLAASAQLRNMATLAGNVLQRTRCPYFRDVSYSACNKRRPGSGCSALDGYNRMHAVLGASENCIATYPGDFAQALIALDAQVSISGRGGERKIAFEALHRKPADRPDQETELGPGEMITAFELPAALWLRRSLYLKIRDRESYEFALASAAVALDLDHGTIREGRIALGGVATVPWRARDAEAALAGKRADESTFRAAAELAFARAKPFSHNAFKVELGKRTIVRALLQAAAMEI